ncbi:MAG TPA: acetate/propionate family kinase [Candidatus Eisenbacteria bacterium]|nr:acetate/propionate family kinase [Candidatus Eisenbacteria bacterium]
MSILVINAGSSTLKAAVYDDTAEARLAKATIDRVPDAHAFEEGLRTLEIDAPGSIEAVRAVGHRVVHGGTEFREPTVVTHHVRTAIERVTELAPLHNRPALAALELATERFPHIPHVAVFDTAFFADLPEHAIVYPVPWEWRAGWGVRRFGFHGLSHSYASERAAALLGSDVPESRVVVLHLGNGCSGSAVVAGKPVATTMGFTPMEGLMMGTRSGSIDPGILIHMLRSGVSLDAVDEQLNHDSGLLGVSGVSSDYREVLDAARSGHPRARLALDLFANRARAAVAALASGMGGLDALVFTAGIGENAPTMRTAIVHGLDFMGVAIDEEKNDRGDEDITRRSRAKTFVIPAREDLVVARETRRTAWVGGYGSHAGSVSSPGL